MKLNKLTLAALLASCLGGVPTYAAIEYANNPAPGDSFTNAGGTNIGQAIAGSNWYYNNVRANGVVGINTTYARSGNGSVFMSTPAVASPGTTNGKADIEFYATAAANSAGNFNATSILGTLGQLSSLSYEWYRDSSSTNAAVQHPALRLQVFDTISNAFGYLVFERAYNSLPTPVDTWTADDVFGNNYRMWSTGSLPDSGVTVGARTLGEWIADFPAYVVTGVSSGVGSGWGQFSGAVDNITFGFGTAPPTTYNFEVRADGVVPEPHTIAVWSLLGLCGSSMAWRSRRQAND
jgi:hypothetical protein